MEMQGDAAFTNEKVLVCTFVENAQSQNPSVLAVINVFGSFEQVHAAKIIFQ